MIKSGKKIVSALLQVMFNSKEILTFILYTLFLHHESPPRQSILSSRTTGSQKHPELALKMCTVLGRSKNRTSHPIFVKSAKHILGVFWCFPRGSHAEKILKFMQKQKAARTLGHELFIHILQCNDVNLCVFGFREVLSLSHVCTLHRVGLKSHPETCSRRAARSLRKFNGD